jgi:hypothetical protein
MILILDGCEVLVSGHEGFWWWRCWFLLCHSATSGDRSHSLFQTGMIRWCWRLSEPVLAHPASSPHWRTTAAVTAHCRAVLSVATRQPLSDSICLDWMQQTVGAHWQSAGQHLTGPFAAVDAKVAPAASSSGLGSTRAWLSAPICAKSSTTGSQTVRGG